MAASTNLSLYLCEKIDHKKIVVAKNQSHKLERWLTKRLEKLEFLRSR